MAASAVACIAAALAFAVIGALLLAIGFSTDQWLVIGVNRTQLLQDPTINQTTATTNLNFFSRTRGLFRECYGNDVSLNLLPSSTVLMNKLSKCTLVDYLGPGSKNATEGSSLVLIRTHLMRTEVAAFCLSAMFAVAAISASASACWRERFARPFTQRCKWAGIVLFVSAFFDALGMALFHGCDYLERNSVTDADFSYFFEKSWPAPLLNATQRWLGFSYVLCWVAVFFECLSAILLFALGWTAARVGKSEDGGVLSDSALYNAAFNGGSAALGSTAGLVTVRIDDVDLDRLDGARRPASAASAAAAAAGDGAGGAGGERGSAPQYHIPRAGLGLTRQPYYGAAG